VFLLLPADFPSLIHPILPGELPVFLLGIAAIHPFKTTQVLHNPFSS